MQGKQGNVIFSSETIIPDPISKKEEKSECWLKLELPSLYHISTKWSSGFWLIIFSDRKICHNRKQTSLIAHWLFPMSIWNSPSWYFYLITSSAQWHWWEQIVFFFYVCPSNIWRYIFLKHPFVVPVILLLLLYLFYQTSSEIVWINSVLVSHPFANVPLKSEISRSNSILQVLYQF